MWNEIEVIAARGGIQLGAHLVVGDAQAQQGRLPGLRQTHTTLAAPATLHQRGAEALLLSGATQFAFPVSSTALPQVMAGKVRALATTGVARLPNFPAVPTLRESLHNEDLAMDSWGGFWAPAGTPTDAVDVLFRALLKVFADPVVRADTEAGGSLMAPSASPAGFSRFVEAETIKYERLVKAANLAVAN